METSLQLLNFALILCVMGAVVLVGLFLLLRWFWLWYWKVDEQVELLRHIAKHIQLLEERDRAYSPPVPPPWAPTGDRVPTPRG